MLTVCKFCNHKEKVAKFMISHLIINHKNILDLENETTD